MTDLQRRNQMLEEKLKMLQFELKDKTSEVVRLTTNLNKALERFDVAAAAIAEQEAMLLTLNGQLLDAQRQAQRPPSTDVALQTTEETRATSSDVLVQTEGNKSVVTENESAADGHKAVQLAAPQGVPSSQTTERWPMLIETESSTEVIEEPVPTAPTETKPETEGRRQNPKFAKQDAFTKPAKVVAIKAKAKQTGNKSVVTENESAADGHKAVQLAAPQGVPSSQTTERWPMLIETECTARCTTSNYAVARDCCTTTVIEEPVPASPTETEVADLRGCDQDKARLVLLEDDLAAKTKQLDEAEQRATEREDELERATVLSAIAKQNLKSNINSAPISLVSIVPDVFGNFDVAKAQRHLLENIEKVSRQYLSDGLFLGDGGGGGGRLLGGGVGGGVRRDLRNRRKTTRQKPYDSNRAVVIGACMCKGPNEFQIYGKFGQGLDANSVKEAQTHMETNEIAVHCYFGTGAATLHEVVNAYPNVLHDAVFRSQGSSSSSTTEAGPLSVKQLVAPKAKVASRRKHFQKTYRYGRMDVYRPDLTDDQSISFLLRVSPEELADRVGPFSEDGIDDAGEALGPLLHRVVKDGVSRARGRDINDEAFQPSRVAYLGSATTSRLVTSADGNNNNGEPQTKRTMSFGEELHASCVGSRISAVSANRILLHFTIGGLGEHRASPGLVTAQEVFRHLKSQINDSPLNCIGSTAVIVYAITIAKSNNLLTVEPSSDIQVIPAWLITVCVILLALLLAALWGVLWRCKRLTCCCMARYGTEAGSLEPSEDQIATTADFVKTGHVSSVFRPPWIRLCKTLDRLVTTHLV
eukprot:GHVS01003855.1.p1 GENE.GHVS01003855.1~~GHVS01003855.1.p1  ORF type:complete len:814 (+),score=94.69 GHVS01003855.1:1057-3498(+)